ncbi:MAG: glycosyltransferase family 2 protein, partial [Acidobacteriaceae bacterium]|nr:glycosyltransferase family 2 protein [Acidobacteriaceae bacterium]
MPPADASVIVLAYRTTANARACIQSILAAETRTSFEIILLLNGVGIAEANRLGTLARTRIIRAPLNLGFSRGNNLAALQSKTEFIVFVNDDARVEDGWLDELLRTARLNPVAGAVGSCILFPDGKLQEAGSVIWSDGTTAPIGRGDQTIDGPAASVQDVDFCSANGLLVRRSTWDAVGGFDPSFYPAYYEDVDLCLAIRHRFGQRVLYEPRSRLRHSEAMSSDYDFRTFLFARNVRRLRQKWSNELHAYPKPQPLASAKAARRQFREAQARILVIDDRPPDAGLGSGFGRFGEFFAQLRDRQ